MLRSPHLRRQLSQSFICWRCIAKSTPVSNGDCHLQRRSGVPRTFRRSFRGGRIARAGVDAQMIVDAPPEPPPCDARPQLSPFRQRLRQWEVENADTYKMAPLPEEHVTGGIFNSTTRPQSGIFEAEKEDNELDDFEAQVFDQGELVDVGNKRAFLSPGDLVVLSSVGSRQHELAIYVRELDKQSQFYTMSGRWIHRFGGSAQFSVHGFVEAKELDDIIPYLPESDVPTEQMDRLQFFELTLPRTVGRPLTIKMTEFRERADAAYQMAAARFDNAHQIVAHAHRFTYKTLDQIAEKVLSGFIPKMEDGRFSQEVRYALHRSLMQDDIGFRAQTAAPMRAGGEYEINALNEVNSTNSVTRWIRSYQEARMKKSSDIADNPLAVFARKARQLIDTSRQHRAFTPYGVIGPYSGTEKGEDAFRYGHPHQTFHERDTVFLKFLESWVCLDSISQHSPLNGIGSAILRAIGRYQDIPLNRSAGWTALQELGAIPPWESRAAYELRLPNTGRRLKVQPKFNLEIINKIKADSPEESVGKGTPLMAKNIDHLIDGEDSLKHLRKDWGDLPIYCADDPQANELDDGISVEATENPEEFWVHVHTADPAAHFKPHELAGMKAEFRTQTIYLPGRVTTMLSDESFVQDRLSLGSGRPCLTFSAKMNFSGEIVESNITLGIARNVVYMTHETLQEIATGEPTPKPTVYTLGSDTSKESRTSRDLLDPHHVSDAIRNEIGILQKIQVARWKLLAQRGGAFRRPPTAALHVSFEGADFKPPKTVDSLHYYGDPAIRMAVDKNQEGSDLGLVACFMLCASEVAAKWCQARGIPVPYRVTPFNPEKDPAEYYRKVYVPAMNNSKTGEVPLAIQIAYSSLIPPVQYSTTAGPHVALGMEMMARCTSPLRRYGDLLTHWQIEAALLEEHRLGQSLVGNTREDFLPFSEAQIQALLPRLSLREKLIQRGQQNAIREWALQYLVRSWHFKEVEMPSSLTFSLRSIHADRGYAGGVVDELLIGAKMALPNFVPWENLKVDDKFEVEIERIDVWQRDCSLRCVRQLESQDSSSSLQ